MDVKLRSLICMGLNEQVLFDFFSFFYCITIFELLYELNVNKDKMSIEQRGRGRKRCKQSETQQKNRRKKSNQADRQETKGQPISERKSN